MGLLSHIDAIQSQPKGPGLLSLAEQYEDGQPLSFYDWCKKNDFSHAALFQRDDRAFYITKSIGLDAETIALSTSTTAFWDGTLTTNGDWQSFSRIQAGQFNQFLSEGDLSNMVALHFIKLEDLILMILQEDEDFTLPITADVAKKSLIQILYTSEAPEASFAKEAAIQKGLSISNAHLYLLSVKLAVSTAVSQVAFPDDYSRQKLLNTIYAEIFRICATLFRKPNCCELGKDGEIKIAFFAKDELDEELLQFHLANTLAELVGTEAAKSIILLAAGICPNVKGTLAFLQQG